MRYPTPSSLPPIGPSERKVLAETPILVGSDLKLVHHWFEKQRAARQEDWLVREMEATTCRQI